MLQTTDLIISSDDSVRVHRRTRKQDSAGEGGSNLTNDSETAFFKHSGVFILKTILAAAAIALTLVSTSLFAHTPDRILVIANQNSSESQAIADYYVKKRAIPSSQLCLIDTTTSDTIDRESFEQQILRPVAEYLAENLLQDQILYVVTTQGVPLIVEGDSGPVGDLASVDSELALLYRYLVFGEYSYFGRIENPYFIYQAEPEELRPFNRKEYDIYLVTRLMGKTLKDVEALVDRSLDPSGSDGVYFLDLRSRRGSIPADWLEETAALLQAQRHTITREILIKETLAGYAGWDALVDPSQLQWAAGGLAVLLGESDPSFLERPDIPVPASELFTAEISGFVASGASGFGGFVANPTIDGNFRPNILFASYLSGHNLAESYYRSLRYLSWRHVVVGDPLLSPYGERTSSQRKETSAGADLGIDSYTGLPSDYSRRRALFLTSRYSAAENAVQNLLRAERLSDQELWPEALQSVDSCLQEDPTIPAAHLLKAELLEREKDFKGSFDHYRQASQFGKASKELYYKLVELALLQPDEIQNAEPYARWLYVRFGDQEQRAVGLWARLQLELGNLSEAAATYHRLLGEDGPENFDYLSALGEIYYKLENWEAAKVYIQKALDSDVSGEPVKDQRSKIENDSESGMRNPESPSSASRKPQAAGRRPLEQMLADVNQRLQEEQTSAEVVERNKPPEIVPARIIHRTPVDYPKGARDSWTQGEVVLKLLIDEEGNLLKSEPLMGPKALAKAAMKAVQDWRFEPRKVRGRPEASLLTVRINFKLERP